MRTRALAAYGLLGAPLAMSALPVYVYAPKLYGDQFGLGLTLTGAVLLLSRVVDTTQDPWLGRLTDIMQGRPGGATKLLLVATLVLAVSFVALFNPPRLETHLLALWLGVSLILVYTAHSAINISYLAWGVRTTQYSMERTQLVFSREAFGILGVILATLIPTILSLWLSDKAVWLVFSLLFVILLSLSAWVIQQHANLPLQPIGRRQPLLQPLLYLPFRRLAILFMFNGLGIATAATLSLFYIADVLQAESKSGLLLALYFISGAIALPLWLKLAKRVGKCLVWIIASVLAIIGFAWVLLLGNGDLIPYAIICILTGAAFGADLAMPAAIAADIIPENERASTGGYFGIWSLINKSVLAIAAGVSLPLLALNGYQPGTQEGLQSLTILYAAIPCTIKVVTATLIWVWRPSLEINHAT